MEDSDIIYDEDCPAMTDEQFKVMTLVLSHDGTRGGSSRAIYYQGMEEERLKSLRNLMDSMNWTLQESMAALKIPAVEYDKYAEVI